MIIIKPRGKDSKSFGKIPRAQQLEKTCRVWGEAVRRCTREGAGCEGERRRRKRRKGMCRTSGEAMLTRCGRRGDDGKGVMKRKEQEVEE